jgi:hypothetical protein
MCVDIVAWLAGVPNSYVRFSLCGLSALSLFCGGSISISNRLEDYSSIVSLCFRKYSVNVLDMPAKL